MKLPSRRKVVAVLFVLLSLAVVPHSVDCLSLSKHNKPKHSSPYFTYKSMKRMEIPALFVSIASRLVSRWQRFQPNTIIPTTATNDDADAGRVAIVTGSNTGVGYETAKALVQNHGYQVVIACRSPEKGQRACDEINNNNGANNHHSGKAVFVESLVLSDFDSVRAFGKIVNEKYATIDVLINNAGVNSAGVVKSSSSSSEDNNHNKGSSSSSLDTVFCTNFLGHFLLTNLLLDKCKRIVNLGSVMHHFPNYSKKNSSSDVNSLEFWRDKAIVNESSDEVRKTYGPSKLAAILFTTELQRRYGSKIRSMAVNPGAVYSDIWRNYSPLQKRLFRLLYLTPEQGCQTSVAASVLEFDPHVIYLQPYRLPRRQKRRAPHPVYELLGSFAGFVETTPRLPADGGVQASQSMFRVCEELTECEFPNRWEE